MKFTYYYRVEFEVEAETWEEAEEKAEEKMKETELEYWNWGSDAPKGYEGKDPNGEEL